MVAKIKKLYSFEEYVKTEPSWDKLKKLACKIVFKHVWSPKHTLQCKKPQKKHNYQFKNMLILQQYLLLYEELFYAMDAGDISHLETCFLLIYGGNYLNHIKDHILAESSLMEVYKNTQIQLKKLFCLNHKTTCYSSLKIKNTF
ncbi:hypothetical protein AN958_10099 [Leucoagaricus sp. SymC.cos]|nr:hypothetical protein AN958_10099 [Leucoagaricus sp. SymC.cos]